MSGSTLVVYGILAATITMFALGRLRLDLVALLALLALVLSGILTPVEALAGFSDPLVIMIAALFVVAAAVFRTGLAERFGARLGRLAGTSRPRATAVVMIGAGLLSAFVSTTGTVALMLPVTTLLARRAGLSPSLLLLPLAVGALLGGLLTLIATPPNIIVSNQLMAAGYEPFGFFDFTPVGVVMLALGSTVLTLFGHRLLPTRAPVDRPVGTDSVAMVSPDDLVRGYFVGQIMRVRVAADSPLVGVSPAAAALRRRYGVNVVTIRRARGGAMVRVPRTADEPLQAGDELDVHATPEAVTQLLTDHRLDLIGGRPQPEAVLAEVLLPPRSRLIGRTIMEVRVRTRYGVNVLSIRRQGAPIDGDLGNTPLQFADMLLIAGTPRRIEQLRRETGDFVVVAQTEAPERRGPLSRRELMALLVLGGMLVLLTTEVVPSAIAVLLAAVALVVTRCVDMAEAYRQINWETVVLIAAILPMATALQKTGGLDVIVAQLGSIGAMGPMAMLAALFVITGVMGQLISNTATAALIAPVAMRAAVEMGVSPYPLLMTVAIAASTSFATPVATPANMLVQGPGDYRFLDFVRVGLPLQLLVGLVTMLIVPLLFPF